MAILDRLLGLVRPEAAPAPSEPLTRRVVLGALLSLVSGADGRVTSEETAAVRGILARRGYADAAAQDDILAAAARAVDERIDVEGFTREVNAHFDYGARLDLIRDCFAVAWADRDLAHGETETVRKIATLLWIDPKDFIAAKLETKPDA